MRDQAVSGCALSLVLLVISYGALDAVVSHTFLESLRNNAFYNLTLIVPSVIAVWLIYFVWNLFYQPAAWHYEIAPSSEKLIVTLYNAWDHKTVGIKIGNPSNQDVTDVRVWQKSAFRIYMNTKLRLPFNTNEDNHQFTQGNFDRSESITIPAHREKIIYIAKDENGAPVFLLKHDLPPIPLETITTRIPISMPNAEDIVDERQVAIFEVELEIDGLIMAGDIKTKTPTETLKSIVTYEKRTWVDLFGGASQMQPFIQIGVYPNAPEEPENQQVR